jgi:tRNA(Ile)-lysidine synthase
MNIETDDRNAASIAKNGNPQRLIPIVEETIAEYGMFQGGERVLVCVSGGADSVALLHALLELRPVFDLHIEVAHLNHTLRGEESLRDADFIAALAEKLRLPFHIEKIDVNRLKNLHGTSLEETARHARYQFFEEAAKSSGCEKIALGHHADDNAELVLMNTIRGSGPAGLSGIPPVRESRIVRPLIRVDRQTIRAFLIDRGHSWVEDSSNTDTRFTRNRIRHLLIPMLEDRFNSSVRSSLNRLGRILKDENEWIESILNPAFDRLVHLSDDGKARISAGQIQETHVAVQRRMLRRILCYIKGDSRRIELAHIESIRKLIAGTRTNGRLMLPDGIQVIKQGDVLVFYREHGQGGRPAIDNANDDAPVYAYRIFEDGFSPMELKIPETGMRLRFSPGLKIDRHDFQGNDPWTAFFDMEKTPPPFIVRNVEPGDRFQPLGLKGTQK